MTFYNSIKKLISFNKKVKITKSKFNNIVIVTSGFKPKNDLANMIVKLNIIIKSSVSKNTDYLIEEELHQEYFGQEMGSDDSDITSRLHYKRLL